MKKRPNAYRKAARLTHWRADTLLLVLILVLCSIGLLILYSASNSNFHVVLQQASRMLAGLIILFMFAYIPPEQYQRWAPWFFGGTLILLVLVLLLGHTSQGARRWLNFGWGHFQPSEFMKLAMPVMLACYLGNKSLPPKTTTLGVSLILLAIPTLLIAKQPDLGTAILVLLTGFFVIFLAGLSLYWLAGAFAFGLLCTPILWHFMHQYQRNRVLTFLNPERDPLGSGYHIIQSKIAIGSGGLLGKGFLQGTQSHLQFLPAHATDFIFAVISEEFGLFGCVLVLLLFFGILARSLFISVQAQNNFNRLLSGSLCLTFIFSCFINVGMVMGLLPVVGVPLPLVSYGGSSILTTMASFGMIMSIHTHRKLWSS